jgi:hypothetical protein
MPTARRRHPTWGMCPWTELPLAPVEHLRRSIVGEVTDGRRDETGADESEWTALW